MLPTEAFAEAVAFFMCQCTVFNARGQIFLQDPLRDAGSPLLHLGRWYSNYPNPRDPTADDIVDTVLFPSEDDTSEFIAAALPKCIFDDLSF